MKNFIILILLGIIAYLVYTSGIFDRAVQSVPQLLAGTPDPNETPRISVTVYSPYGTGTKTPAPGAAPNAALGATPAPRAALTLLPQATAIPDVPIFVPPTPVIIVPDVPPTLALPSTPTPAAPFQITLDAPRDGDTADLSPLPVKGVTAPNAVVSVNDVVGLADGDGRFYVAVPLQAGPNVLEVIASQPNGQQSYVIVTVMYTVSNPQ